MAVEESRPRQMQPNDCFPSSTVDPRTSGRKKCKGRNDLRSEKEKIERRILASTKVKKLAVIRRRIMSWDIDQASLMEPLALRRASRQTLSCLVRSVRDMSTSEQRVWMYLHLFNSGLELAGDFCGSLPIFRGF